jgi:hypothetical protein
MTGHLALTAAKRFDQPEPSPCAFIVVLFMLSESEDECGESILSAIVVCSEVVESKVEYGTIEVVYEQRASECHGLYSHFIGDVGERRGVQRLQAESRHDCELLARCPFPLLDAPSKSLIFLWICRKDFPCRLGMMERELPFALIERGFGASDTSQGQRFIQGDRAVLNLPFEVRREFCVRMLHEELLSQYESLAVGERKWFDIGEISEIMDDAIRELIRSEYKACDDRASERLRDGIEGSGPESMPAIELTFACELDGIVINQPVEPAL